MGDERRRTNMGDERETKVSWDERNEKLNHMRRAKTVDRGPATVRERRG